MWEEGVMSCKGVRSRSCVEDGDVEVFGPGACVSWLEQFAIASVAAGGGLDIRFEEVYPSFVECVVHFQDQSCEFF